MFVEQKNHYCTKIAEEHRGKTRQYHQIPLIFEILDGSLSEMTVFSKILALR